MAKKRKTGSRDVKPVFRIYTEGKETEINYIKNYLKSKDVFDPRIEPPVQPKNHDPYGLLTTAKEDMVPGDEVWIVFDCDGHDKKPETFQEARDAKINIAYSSICFETWILLHFEYTTSAYSCCDELTAKRLESHIPDYDKAANKLFAVVTKDGGLSKARKRAEKLCKAMVENNPGKKIYELNPYTDMHKLLDAIDKFIKES
jgi:hypothetical protein